jgi:hypothetical protein
LSGPQIIEKGVENQAKRNPKDINSLTMRKGETISKLLSYEQQFRGSITVLVSLCKEVSGAFIYSTAPLLHVLFPSLYRDV